MKSVQIKNEFIDVEVLEFGKKITFFCIILNQNQADWNDLIEYEDINFRVAKTGGLYVDTDNVTLGRHLGHTPLVILFSEDNFGYDYLTILNGIQKLAKKVESDCKSIMEVEK